MPRGSNMTISPLNLVLRYSMPTFAGLNFDFLTGRNESDWGHQKDHKEEESIMRAKV